MHKVNLMFGATFHQLRIFMTVAECQSITKAANLLNMTQPAVSIQLKHLTERCGLPLIEVIGKRLYITQAGNLVYEGAQDVMQRLSSLDQQLLEMKGGVKGQISIAIATTAQYFIPRILGLFRRRFPTIELSLNVTNREAVMGRLSSNQDDFAVLSQLPSHISIEYEKIFDDQLCIVVPPHHPLVSKSLMTLQDLEKENFIFREPGSGTRIAMEKFLNHYHLYPKVFFEFGSNEAIKQAIMANFGISLLPKSCLKLELELQKLYVLTIDGLSLEHPWYVLYPKGKVLSPMAGMLLEFFKKGNYKGKII